MSRPFTAWPALPEHPGLRFRNQHGHFRRSHISIAYANRHILFRRLHRRRVVATSVEAPSQLKTRARLEPGSAAYAEEAGITESNQQVRNAGPFPDVPLTVIAATDHGEFFKQWEPTLMHLQQQLATLSPRGRLIVAQGSGHDIQIDRPEIVVEAVRDMVRAAKTHLVDP